MIGVEERSGFVDGFRGQRLERLSFGHFFGWGCCVLWRLWVVCLIIKLRYGGEEKELSEDAQKWSRETNLAWQIAAETA